MNVTFPAHTINKSYSKLIVTVSAILGTLLLGAMFMFSKNNMIAGFAILLFPVPILYLYWVFKFPRIGFISVLYANYFAIGLTRYVPAPFGLAVDGLLVITWLSLIFTQFSKKLDWKKAGRDYTYFALIWTLMTFLQIINPEAVSREAWFYGMRGYALYTVLTIPLVYIMFNRPQDLDTFIKIFAWFTIIGIAKGIGQKYIGVDRWEQQWLNVPGNRSTHILFGKLRVFSIFSDAGTYGSSMGYTGVLFTIFGIHEKKIRKRLFYFFIGIASLYAMMISGTRSAIAVPLLGFVVYTILSKRVTVFITVGSIVFLCFFLLKYTNVGQGNYDIRRMRSAFAEDNASLNVRVENRKLFSAYLKTRPFGGGVGSSGNMGLRFSPNSFLAQTATDGYYIQVWAEQGIVGLSFYLLMLFYFVLKSSYLIFFRLKKPDNIYKAIGFTCGMYGLMVSAYSSSSLGQLPNIIVVFASITMVSIMPEWEKQETVQLVSGNATIS
ncbi:MAG: O-antigen ligase family protein [Paludibacter sp.]